MITPSGDPPVDRIAGYRVMDRLGEGGMAVVYRAQQENPSRTVAIKVIKPGLFSDSARVRFQHEIESLGRFQHPGIAQIYDAGTIDGHPYFVMELIEGLPLTDYADANGLTVRQRVALIRDVCDAVHHAHQRGVIHRDLKPGNILVDSSGRPKVLDFGLARMTDSDVQVTSMHTAVGQLIGTLAYMSPEQASASDDLDVRSDVYSLGVILHEMLTGAFPYLVHQALLHEVINAIRESEPTSLSSHRKELRGDLETIAAKTLSKDRARRYPSASELGADLGRFLDDEPVLARPPSAIYQIGKFARRHKALVGGVGATAGALVLGTAVAIHFAVEARSASRNAGREAATSTAMVDFLNVDLLGALDVRRSRGEAISLRDAVDRAAARLGDRFIDQPEVEAGIRQTLSEVYASLGEIEMARDQLRRALEVVPPDLVDARYEPAVLNRQLGSILLTLGDLQEAERRLRSSVAETERLHGEGLELALSLEALGRFLIYENRLDAARESVERAATIFRDPRFADQEARLRVRECLADIERLAGNGPLALDILTDIRATRVESLGEDHPDTIRSLQELTTLQIDLYALEAAEAHCRELRELGERVYGPRHPVVATALYLKGRIHIARGELGRAATEITQALALFEADEGAHTLRRLDALLKLGNVRQRQGDIAGAGDLFAQALELATTTYGDRHLSTVSARSRLGFVMLGLGDLEQSHELFESALATCREIAPDGDHIQHVLNGLAFLYKAEGDLARAEEYMREVVERARASREQDDPGVASLLENLGNMLQAQGKNDECIEILLEVLDIRRRTLGPAHEAVGRTLSNLALTYRNQGQFQRSVECDVEAIEITAAQYGPDNANVAKFSAQIAQTLEQAIRENEDVQFDLAAERIDESFASGVEHAFLEELAVRIR